MIILICFVTFLATLSGGLFALRFRDQLHLILGFSAGAVIGVVFFELFPEAISLGIREYSIENIAVVAVSGFLFYMILDRLALLHAHMNTETEGLRGKLGAGSLSIHSFLDGVAIGLAFQVSENIGIMIAIAVIAHDFSDGINTVSIVIKDEGKSKSAFMWLLIDAIAPAVGVLSTVFFKLPDSLFGLVLSLFAGFFLYIGASDLLPESQHRHPKIWTTFMTIAGVAVMYIVMKFAVA